MNRELALFAVLAISAAILFSAPAADRAPYLLTQEKAEAFELFEKWIIKHSRNYREDEEKSYRFGKFFENYLFVQEHKRKYAQGLETFDVELNKFADLDNYEFRALFTGLKRRNPEITSECQGEIQILDNLPESVDWTDKAISPVKNQGMCGSCWAFSACGALEGLSSLAEGKIVNFAPQQLVDCAGGPYQNEGCNGGDMVNAFWYVIDNGISLEEKYPYKGKDQKCAYK